jgi:hypothetical protein
VVNSDAVPYPDGLTPPGVIAACGRYTVTMLVTDSQGCNDTASATFYMNQPPEIEAAALAQPGRCAAAVLYTATVYDCDDDPLTYLWTFYEDGVPVGTSTQPAGVYTPIFTTTVPAGTLYSGTLRLASAGPVTASLAVFDGAGCSATDATWIDLPCRLTFPGIRSIIRAEWPARRLSCGRPIQNSVSVPWERSWGDAGPFFWPA